MQCPCPTQGAWGRFTLGRLESYRENVYDQSAVCPHIISCFSWVRQSDNSEFLQVFDALRKKLRLSDTSTSSGVDYLSVEMSLQLTPITFFFIQNVSKYRRTPLSVYIRMLSRSCQNATQKASKSFLLSAFTVSKALRCDRHFQFDIFFSPHPRYQNQNRNPSLGLRELPLKRLSADAAATSHFGPPCAHELRNLRFASTSPTKNTSHSLSPKKQQEHAATRVETAVRFP